MLLAGATVVSLGASRGGGLEGGTSVLAESGWQSGVGLQGLAAGNVTGGNETEGGGIDGCPKLPACKKYVVNSLFWTFVNTLEVLAVRDVNGSEVSEPAGFVKVPLHPYPKPYRLPDGCRSPPTPYTTMPTPQTPHPNPKLAGSTLHPTSTTLNPRLQTKTLSSMVEPYRGTSLIRNTPLLGP